MRHCSKVINLGTTFTLECSLMHLPIAQLCEIDKYESLAAYASNPHLNHLQYLGKNYRLNELDQIFAESEKENQQNYSSAIRSWLKA